MADIKIGDVVKLKSGSPWLTVNAKGWGEDGSDVQVFWFVDGELKQAVVSPSSLEIVE